MSCPSRPNRTIRYQGHIGEWRDEKGFGFITPGGGGERVFVHIKAVAGSNRRPKSGDLVTYRLVTDGKGRMRAENVQYAISARKSNGQSISGKSILRIGALVVAIVAIGILAVTSDRTGLLLAAYIIMSLITFGAYVLDKSAAQAGRWRTPEKTLHLLALLGGWPGAMAAQWLIRHKSSKTSFQAMFWLTIILNVLLLGWLLHLSGIDLSGTR